MRMQQLKVSLTPGLRKRIEEEAAKRGCSINAEIRDRLVRSYEEDPILHGFELIRRCWEIIDSRLDRMEAAIPNGGPSAAYKQIADFCYAKSKAGEKA